MNRTWEREITLGGMTVRYCLVEERLRTESVSYGIEVSTSAGERACVRDITDSYDGIRALLELLIRNTVTPVTLRDVIEDWLA